MAGTAARGLDGLAGIAGAPAARSRPEQRSASSAPQQRLHGQARRLRPAFAGTTPTRAASRASGTSARDPVGPGRRPGLGAAKDRTLHRRERARSMTAPCKRPRRVAPVSASLDRDLLHRLLGFKFLGQRHFKNAVPEAGLDLVRFDGLGNPNRTGERAEAPLLQVEVLLLLDFLLFLLPLD